MTWWSWLLEIAGLALLGTSIFLIILRMRKNANVSSWSLLVLSITSALVALFFVIFSPARPGAALVVTLALVGLVSGAGTCFLIKAQFLEKTVSSSLRQWHIVTWLSITLLSSILVIAGTSASKVAVAFMVFSSLCITGYSATLYIRFTIGMYSEESPARQAVNEAPSGFCVYCGAQLVRRASSPRFCENCGKQIAGGIDFWFLTIL